jgi:hypothetical protein
MSAGWNTVCKDGKGRSQRGAWREPEAGGPEIPKEPGTAPSGTRTQPRLIPAGQIAAVTALRAGSPLAGKRVSAQRLESTVKGGVFLSQQRCRRLCGWPRLSTPAA